MAIFRLPFNHVRAKKRHIQNLHADRIEQLNKYLT